MRTNTALTLLDLRDNNLGDEGATALARAALRQPKLKHHSSNKAHGTADPDDEELEERRQPTLGAWSSLKVLNLRNNSVGDSGAASLARALRALPRPCLAHLNLRGNA